MRVKRVVLKDHCHIAILGLDLVDDAFADGDLAVGNVLQPGDHPQQRALAAAGRADENDELLIGNFEVDAMKDFLRVIGFAYVAETDGGQGTLVDAASAATIGSLTTQD